MTILQYLKHRRRHEVVIAVAITTLIVATGATSEIIENLRNGIPSDWQVAWAKELSSGIAVLLLIPALALFLKRLNLNYSNLSRRAPWLLVGFLVFSLLHIGIFTVVRTLLWATAGETYNAGSIGWSLLYEMRKDFLVYVGIVAVLYGYEFILNRLQGEARFLARSTGPAASSENTPGRYRTQFLVKMLNKEYLVRVEEIDWVESASNYVLMHCGDRSYPMRSTLAGLANQLDQQHFMRVQRTAIVNLASVESLKETDELRAQLTSGDLVPVSRTYFSDLKRALGGRLPTAEA